MQKRSKKLEQLILSATGQHYKVYVKKFIHGGYGATTYNSRKIIHIRQDQLNCVALIWHEMGHIVRDRDGQTLIEAEYDAQMWALTTLVLRKQIEDFEESLAWIKYDWRASEKETARDDIYVKVRAKILKKLRSKGVSI